MDPLREIGKALLVIGIALVGVGDIAGFRSKASIPAWTPLR